MLPPGGLVALAVLGLVLLAFGRGGWRRLGVGLVGVQVVGLWVLSCSGFALWLHQVLLPSYAPVRAEQLAGVGVQAVVVLGGGVDGRAPEYGQAQPGAHTLQRLRYGVHLARGSGLPLAFAGGVGWAAAGTGTPTEGEVAARTAREWFALAPRWMDDQSRDTRENAARMQALLAADGVRHIALVTNDWHMARALRDFTAAGFTVTPAPMGYATSTERAVLRWLPSASGLALSALALREWIGLRLT